MANTAIPKREPKELIDANALFVEARRDYFLDNLFIAEWVLDDLCEDENYDIHVIDVFDRRFITLTYRDSDLEMAYVQRNGSVFACAKNGMCGGIQSPMLYGMHDINRQGKWYAGDEIEQIGSIDLEAESHKWYNMVNTIKPQTFKVGKPTLQLIINRVRPEVTDGYTES